MRRSVRAIWIGALAALAFGGWFLLRGSDGPGHRAGPRPVSESGSEAPRPPADLVRPSSGLAGGDASRPPERTAVAEKAAVPAGEGLVEIRDAASAPLELPLTVDAP